MADASAPDAVPAARVAGALEVRVTRGRLQLLQLSAQPMHCPSAASNYCSCEDWLHLSKAIGDCDPSLVDSMRAIQIHHLILHGGSGAKGSSNQGKGAQAQPKPRVR